MNPILGLATSWSSITEIVDRCKKLKVNAVALRVASLPKSKNTGFVSKQSLIEIQGKLSEAGIKINTLIQWFGDEDCLVKTPSKNNHAIESMLETIRIQGEIGINCQLHYVYVPEPSQSSLDGMYWDGMLSIYKKIIHVLVRKNHKIRLRKPEKETIIYAFISSMLPYRTLSNTQNN